MSFGAALSNISYMDRGLDLITLTDARNVLILYLGWGGELNVLDTRHAKQIWYYFTKPWEFDKNSHPEKYCDIKKIRAWETVHIDWASELSLSIAVWPP